ncbi:Alpha/Beta hydrolase protein [Thelonectria olida]|uniref:Alpha/Beta hydrolase protein n=1 Tax=Thelonectria olida TaxID=1576542 RepID=A0A9P8VRF2_9HYPO|nr:Alpha/Beta hydrolase protein [Thelonectria olida]
MNTFPRTGFNGYTSKTFTFKSTPEGGSISVDVAYPEETDGSPSTVLIHYHGGFLIVGDRYSFLPYWLVHACASRKWIFVTPEYRLIPETTAHAALEDAVDAYEWTRSSLPDLLGHPVGSVLLAGSSAGGYLALSTASAVVEKPAALLLIYGLHDPAGSRYTTPGFNIFGRPAIETAPVLREFPKRKQNEDREIISAYALPADPAEDRRFSLASALHIDALFPDYITGVDGLSREMAKRGIEAIPEDHHRLFPLSFGNLSNIPRTMLLHGLNDSAVPVECSVQAEKKLRAAGSEVFTEFPEDGEHGFDVRVGNLDVEGAGGDGITAVESLRNVIRFLHSSVTNEASA